MTAGTQSQVSTMFTLRNQTAIVVGAASGIGRAIAQLFGEAGAFVVCADIEEAGAQSVMNSIINSGGQASAVFIDVTSEESVEQAFDEVAASHGNVDVLVTTPGINFRRAIKDITTPQFDALMAVNFKGTFLVARAGARLMSQKTGGRMILLSSIRADVVEPGMGVYGATKAAIVQLARALAAELGPLGIRVNCIAPGIIRTPLSKLIWDDQAWREAYSEKTALGRWGDPEEIAGPALFLATNASSYVTGAVLFVDGGWTSIDGRFNPPIY